jgi:hypothetical protein
MVPCLSDALFAWLGRLVKVVCNIWCVLYASCLFTLWYVCYLVCVIGIVLRVLAVEVGLDPYLIDKAPSVHPHSPSKSLHCGRAYSMRQWLWDSSMYFSQRTVLW